MAPSAGPRNRASGRIKNEKPSGVGGRASVVPDSQMPAERDNSVQQSVNGTSRSQASVSRPPRGTQIVDLEDDD